MSELKPRRTFAHDTKCMRNIPGLAEPDGWPVSRTNGVGATVNDEELAERLRIEQAHDPDSKIGKLRHDST